MRVIKGSAVLLGLVAAWPVLLAQTPPQEAALPGPVGPSPYTILRGWQKPFAEPGFAFGGNSGIFAESPDRIIVAQRGETRLPNPVPQGFAGFVGSIGINALNEPSRRVWQNCIFVLGAAGKVKEVWKQWDHLCEGADGPGPHHVRINPYDSERSVWVVNETLNQIFVLSNDGRRLLRTLGEKNVGGADGTHFGKPQDVAFLPDGRVLVADGLDNHRVMILDREMKYLGEFGSYGTGPGQFNGIHAVAVGPGNRIFALDRLGGRVNVYRTTADPAKVEFVESFGGFRGMNDVIVNDDCLWVTTPGPLRFVKMNFKGEHLYTWTVSSDLPDGFLELHSISADSAGNLYIGDNQYGRTQKLVPKPGVDKTLIIQPHWAAR